MNERQAPRWRGLLGLRAALAVAIAIGVVLALVLEIDRAQDGFHFTHRAVTADDRPAGVARYAVIRKTETGWEILRGSAVSQPVRDRERWHYQTSSNTGELGPVQYMLLQPPGTAALADWTPESWVRLSVSVADKPRLLNPTQESYDGARLMFGDGDRFLWTPGNATLVPRDIVSVPWNSYPDASEAGRAHVLLAVLDSQGDAEWTLDTWRSRIAESLSLAADALERDVGRNFERQRIYAIAWGAHWEQNTAQLADLAMLLRIHEAAPALERLEQHWQGRGGAHARFVLRVLTDEVSPADLEPDHLWTFLARWQGNPWILDSIAHGDAYPRHLRDAATRAATFAWRRQRDQRSRHWSEWTRGERLAVFGSLLLLSAGLVVLGLRGAGWRTQMAGGALAIALFAATLAGVAGFPLVTWAAAGVMAATAVALAHRAARPAARPWPAWLMAVGAACTAAALADGGFAAVLARAGAFCTFVSLAGLAIAADDLWTTTDVPPPVSPGRVRRGQVVVLSLVAIAGAAVVVWVYEPGYGKALFRLLRRAAYLVPTGTVLLLATVGVLIGASRFSTRDGERSLGHGAVFTPALLLGVCAHVTFLVLAARSAVTDQRAHVLSWIGIAAALIVVWTAVTRVLAGGRPRRQS